MAKRAFDIVASALGLLMLLPILLVVAVAIRWDSSGPAFFRQERVGRGGSPFLIYKFRTMHVNAQRRGGQLTVGDDPRITRVGRVLRKYKLDELPQLINVFRGDMSLVGPRPEVPRYVALYDERQRAVLDVRPGITDPASIAYRDENAVLAVASDPEAVYIQEIMPAKLEMNLDYLGRRSLLTDLGIILDTLLKVVRR